MPNDSVVAALYKVVRRCAFFIPVISPVLFIGVIIIHAFNLYNVNSETSWIMWFVRDEYAYVSANYGIDSDALYILHDYDLVVSISLSLFAVYVLLTIIIVVATRSRDRDVVYGTAIMRNIMHRAQTNHMTPIYDFLAKYALAVVVIVYCVVSAQPGVNVILFRAWATHSFVTFVLVQSIVFPLALLFTSEWIIMGAIVLVALAQRRETKNIGAD